MKGCAMSATISRRGLLSRRVLRGEVEGPRPPWSTAHFREACDGCGDCIAACPERILVRDGGGLPVVAFAQGGCNFCGDCAKVCAPGAIDATAAAEGRRPWLLVADLNPACISLQGVACRLCGDPCEPGAIRFRPLVGGRSLPDISTDRCTGCGICVSACPVGALRVQPAAAA